MSARDIEFAPGKLGRLHRPEGDGPFPAVVELAGGGWVSGDRLSNEAMNTRLAELGVMVFAIEAARLHAQAMRDVAEATGWFKANAADLGARPDRIGGLGSSSGGQQLMLHAVTAEDEAGLAFMVALWPVLDPLGRYRFALETGRAELIKNHDAYWGGEAAMAQGSPQAIVAEGRATATPPLLVIQGGEDDNVPMEMTTNFAGAYCLAGGSVELALVPAEPHSFFRKRPGSDQTRAGIERVAAFIHARAAP